MKEVKWQMKESFAFPNEFGQPTATEKIKVTPRFTAETVEGRPKLTGIYHLAVTVNFKQEQAENQEVGEAVVIDDLDLTGNTGYFEYAVPFNIDFPPEATDPVTVKALKPSYEIKDHQLAVLWDVACTYEEAGIESQVNEPQTKNEEVIDNSSDTTKAKTDATEPQNKEVLENASEGSENADTQATHEEEQEPTSKTAEVAVGTVATSQGDEVLEFIAELEDGISATSFRLNDILV